MKVTECLNTEHGVFLTQLSVLERLLSDSAGPAELAAATRTLAQAVENHRRAEESVFYPALRRVFGDDFPPLAVMEEEHREIERCIQGVLRGGPETARYARGFVEVLRGHIAKEIEVLFPMAEQRIPADELERLAADCIRHYHESAGVRRCGARPGP